MSLLPFEQNIAQLILDLPTKWIKVPVEKLTSTDEKALTRLVNGGFVDAKLTTTLQVNGVGDPIKIRWWVKGNYMPALWAALKKHAEAVGLDGEYVHATIPYFDEVRLSSNGELVQQAARMTFPDAPPEFHLVTGGPDGSNGTIATGLVGMEPVPADAPGNVSATAPDGFYSPTDIANAIGASSKADAVRKALKRLLDNDRLPDGAWMENADPAKGQAKILYRLSRVRSLLSRFNGG